ncbi:Gfo/Idh/MocA family oxidoreductase [Streptomyces sp. B-S-A8]|uniref:Gfo/Idh/MocA family oxidoreductase n=1 Tax=Streptomyces solicavernae TaxID=3043614 RepID=A0ABT6RS24_9ACTN|nr:Gfo/Idh/MocA family oxidoreductase [Streptomyces sp. B-S-A8]MDI3387243.1 Gfo/Idh/MocA family oxidoreductase [Streptomyces sp. B-S-A8]
MATPQMTPETPAAPLRVGLFGTGPWAARVHGPALAAHPEVELTGVWGRRPEAAGALAKELSTRAYADKELSTRAYADADALIADVDVAAFALPPDVQAEIAARAARAGRHLLLDKPVATKTRTARALADAAAGVASVVFFTLRFSAASAPWLAEQAAVDDWFTASAQWLGSIHAPDAKSPYAASPWRREKGALWDVGPHALSLLLPALGDVTSVTAAARGPLDTVHLLLGHASGASSVATLSLTAPEQAGGVTVELRGASGVATLPEVWGDGPLDAYARAVDALLTAARTGVPHACDVRFGLRVTEILAEAEALLG